MTEIIDHAPDVNVDPAEYRRLLGYPRDHEMGERAQELVDAASEFQVAGPAESRPAGRISCPTGHSDD